MIGIITVHCRHIVDIVVLHCVDKLFNQALVKLEAAKVLCRVFLWDCLLIGVPVDEITSVFD